MTKPFSLLELLGRIGAVLRRAEPPAAPRETPADETLTFGPVVFDIKRYTVHHPEKTVELPAKAFDILRVLARHEGTVVSRDTLMDEVWGEDQFINQRTVNNLVVKLRQTIEADPAEPRFLKTVHGVGYRLDR
ncbi:Sensory transduction protein regX3 [compost metagenome]